MFKSHKKQLETNLTINLNSQEIQKVNKTKFLGIIIDQHLTWKSHIEYIATKISKTIGILCRIRFYINQALLKILYNNLIYPYLYYGNIVWANNYPTRLDKLLKLQKKALRVITFSLYKAPSLPLFQKLNLLDINKINDFLASTFCFNLKSNSLPVYFNDFCIENTQVHNHHTRKCNNLHKKFNRTNFGVYSTRNKVINVWNTIPNEIKQSISINVFKKKDQTVFIIRIIVIIVNLKLVLGYHFHMLI